MTCDHQPLVQAAVAETLAGDRWATTRDQPYPAQLAAWKALQDAYDARVTAARKWLRAHPQKATDDGPGLFGAVG